MHSKTDTVEQSSSNSTCSSHFLKGKLLTLSTSYSVQMKPQTPQSIPEIITYPCDVLDGQLRKCFKITFKDSSIFVEDRINFGSTFRHAWNQQATQISDLSFQVAKNLVSSSRKMVRSKNDSLKTGELQAKTDQKNIVKNVIKAFLKYLKEQNPANETAKSAAETVQKLIQTLKFNNQLIAAIIKQPKTRGTFQQFLSADALDWIQHSKIKNKEQYDTILQKYQQLCAAEEEAQPQRGQVSSRENQSHIDNSLNLRELENYDLEDMIKGFQ